MQRSVVAMPILFLLSLATSGAVQAPFPRTAVTTAKGDHVILSLTVDDGSSRSAASAVIVRVDGRDTQHIVLTPGVGRSAYTALLGPLEAGAHKLQLAPSPYWPAASGVSVRTVSARVVPAGDARMAILRYAPTLGLRADTIGSASDLPLIAYVEDQRQGGAGWVRYSVIFSNEDGGTSTPALLARWGRTTDIELVYEIEWRGGRVVQERIQAPDHKILPFGGAREGDHPYLLVGTLNNMVMDRGLSVAAVRPVPLVVDLASATRESVMDKEPWSYRVMARELASEGRIGADVKDPREYLYVEAKLDLENAAVAVVVQSPNGRVDSAGANETWAVDRNGWVRIAVPSPATATSLQWRCAARKKSAGDVARCGIDVVRAFRLDMGYLPGPNLARPQAFRMADGLSDAVALMPQSNK
jgi:hypothetical protein